ncbi:DNA circularization N-terminal domain-containing protein [Variovorax ureilyticus]|uniref:DNA circularization N-terminal domain-containing protein n=1 Tax=Variovorax ureilyticus TaxID=1836198 RepID=UPI003D672BBA
MSFTGSVQAVLGTEKMISGIYAGAGIPGNPLASNWRAQLRPASLGGVPFAVWGGQLRVGRRNAVHEYPFKDEVWVEDLGRAARRITLTGFIVENAVYGGGNVIQQRDRLIAVCESRDQKTLVHPTLGSLNVSLLDSAMEERWDQGRMFEVSFSFIEAGQRVFPRADVSTGVVVDSAADAAEAALSGDFEASIGSALSQGQAVVDMAVSTAGTWAGNAVSLAGDATNLINTVGSLSGSYSRYFGGRNRGFQNLTAQLSMPTTTITQLVAAGTVARQGVATASSALTAAAVEIAS